MTFKVDKAKLDTIKSDATDLLATMSDRDTMYDEVEEMYMLEDNDLPTGDHIRQTISPNARNAAQGAIRLLTAADPQWSVAYDSSDSKSQTLANKMEQFASAVWKGASRVGGKPLHYDIVTSAILYGQVDVGVMMSDDLVKAMEGASKIRAERAAKFTPLLFEVYSPRHCYPVHDGVGLRSHYTKRTLKAVEVISKWGKDALKGFSGGLYETVEYSEYWDDEYHAAWTDSGDILCAKHGLGFIPIASAIAEGSSLWEGSDYNSRQPFLFTLNKSSLWKRENMVLTAIYTWISAIGGNPKFMFKRNTPGKTMEVDWNNPEAILLDQNEEFGPVNKMVVDPSLQLGFQMAQELGIQSTIYRQSLGEPLGANAPFSMVAMLSQAGRLPLVPYQRICSHVTADIMGKGIELLRGGKGKYNMKNAGKGGSDLALEWKEIPEHVLVDAKYDISMPQDSRMNVQTAMTATTGQTPLVSKRYAREEYLGIGQSDDMDKEIFTEQLSILEAQRIYQEELARQKATQPGMPQQGMAQGGVQQAPMPQQQGDPSQGIPPELMEQMMSQQAQPGLPQPAPEMAGEEMPPMPEEGMPSDQLQ